MSAATPLTLLIVEDHLALREMLTEALETLGYQVVACESAEDALAHSQLAQCQISVLDLNLPGEDGLFLAEQLRLRYPTIGLIMLTVRNQIADKLAGYDAGADIYFPKPVVIEELHAAIQALARRLPGLQNAELTLHFATSQLRNTQQQTTTLTNEDTRLLLILAQANQQPLEYWQLADALELDLECHNLRTILEKRISRLRQKLLQLNVPTTAIKALRGVGYQLKLNVHIE